MSDSTPRAKAEGSFQSTASRYVLKRFAIKLAMILVFAMVQAWSPWGFADALVALSAGSVIMDIAMALLMRQPVRGPDLTYWDEALAFAAIAILAAFFWHTPPTGEPARAAAQPAVQHSR